MSSSSKRKLLFVSIALPPKKDPECIQSGRYLYYLEKEGKWEIEALTSSIPTLFMPYDKSTKHYVNNTSIFTIDIFENKYINYILRKINSPWLERPDSKFTFHLKWKKIIDKLAKPDVIYSRSFPLSSTIMAYKLKLFYQVPWFMHLGDPWTESPLHSFKGKALDYHVRYEKKCFEMADRISFTNEQTKSLYSGKYPKLQDKFCVFHNVYDPEVITVREERKKDQKIRIVYTGGLANTRNAKMILESADRLHQKSKAYQYQIEIIFAGDLDKNNKQLFQKYNIPFVRHIGLLSYGNAKELQNSADVLLVIDSEISDPKKNVFFPSKLLDYSCLGTFILALTEDVSPTNEFLSRNNGTCFSFTEVENLTDWLEAVIIGKIKIYTSSKLDELYSAKHQAKNLTLELEALLKK